ncbi:diphosphomevalonate decarboxylase [Bacteroidota bacterium]|nr:diphosphomevalonate decarboxylase [Bacteroidota bacterium]
MTEMDNNFTSIRVGYQCPSNIALVKYWGKKNGGVQLPANPSISWSLGDLYASTVVQALPRENDQAFVFTLAGESKPSFEPKIASFLTKIASDCLWLVDFTLHIDSQNNFPHGTGIASSAAGFGALSLCLAHIEQLLLGDTSLHTEVGGINFWQRSSYLSRMGSGSACRSMFSRPAVWGETPGVAGSSNLFAVEIDAEVHPSLSNWKDVVLIVDDGEKSVSSSAGHALLTNHPYAEARFGQAQKNLDGIVLAMRNGDVKSFIEIVESEALQLHSMMMTSIPYYVLMRPNTLAIIEQIWRFREQTGLSICFTLDAGANVHFLYDGNIEETVMNFVNNTLLHYCKNGQYLCSDTGKSPVQII